MAGEAPLQFIAEQIGSFNADIALHPGSYLVLADCSSQNVVIRPDAREELRAYEVRFDPPLTATASVTAPLKNALSIQCSRFDKTLSRQHIRDSFSLKILEGRHELLVGMVPLQVSLLPQIFSASNKSGVLTYKLAALQVADVAGQNGPPTPYFVSPASGAHAVTQSQELGKWLFLLPGKYVVELNGTTATVELSEGDQRIITPAKFRIETSSKVDLSLVAKVTGSPTNVEINSDHWLSMNETYLLLPGNADIRIDSSISRTPIVLEEGKDTVLKPRSVTVEEVCDAVDGVTKTECLGSKEVFLYQTDALYPFAIAVTDMPILFFESDVRVSVGGSRDVKYWLNNKSIDSHVKLGRLDFHMTIGSKAGYITDLVRVVAIGGRLTGATVDLPFQELVSLPLFEGSYLVEQFLSGTAVDGERERMTDNVYIGSETIKSMSINVYVSDRKMSLLKGHAAF